MATQHEPVILLVGQPGWMRNALHSLLNAMPGSPTVHTADASLLALKSLDEVAPDLVLVGAGLPDAEVVELVSQVKQLRPRLACVVLTDSIECQQAVQQAGADYSLPGNLPGEQVFEVIQQALAGA